MTRAIVLHAYGEPDNLQLDEVEVGAPAAHRYLEDRASFTNPILAF